jgi:hypothetical protein
VDAATLAEFLKQFVSPFTNTFTGEQALPWRGPFKATALDNAELIGRLAAFYAHNDPKSLKRTTLNIDDLNWATKIVSDRCKLGLTVLPNDERWPLCV